jgi:hypothetical protein
VGEEMESLALVFLHPDPIFSTSSHNLRFPAGAITRFQSPTASRYLAGFDSSVRGTKFRLVLAMWHGEQSNCRFSRAIESDRRDHMPLGLGRGQEGGAQVEERGGYCSCLGHWIGLRMRITLLNESAT